MTQIHDSALETVGAQERSSTALEHLREQCAPVSAPHEPCWRIERPDDIYIWLFDGDRAVAMIHESRCEFELRTAGPHEPCAPAIVPKHYHGPTQVGVRIIYRWQLPGNVRGKRKPALELQVDGPAVWLRFDEIHDDGSRTRTKGRLYYDSAWSAYVLDVTTAADVRHAKTTLEFCNVLPAGIGDSRPGRERYPYTFWQHRSGLRKMGKNPLWFCSSGAQDPAGERCIGPGGFLGFGPDDRQNPVVEMIHSDPPCGAATCDNLQDEHLVVLPAESRHAAATGWFHLEARYRLFCIPQALAEQIVSQAQPFTPGAMLAWKFQHPPTPQLPGDLTRVALPGSPFYGRSDWNEPVPWDKPFNGRLWTVSPDPAADRHYDRTVGHDRLGSIRLRVRGEKVKLAPSSGHTLYTDAGRTYRLGAWIRSSGDARGWVEAAETLFRCGDTGRVHGSPIVTPGSDWRHVETRFTACGDDAPFAETLLCAEGHGDVWFADLLFEAVEN